MNFNPRRSEEPDLNLTSLIDVVLLLLIFFMLSTRIIDESRLLFRKIVDEIKPVLDKVINSPSFIFNKQELDTLASKHCKGSIDSIINMANDVSINKKISVACMRFVTKKGNRNDINKLNRFFIYESPAGSPHDEEIYVRIVSKGEHIANDHPGDVYVISADEINNSSPEGRDQYAELCEDEFLLLEKNYHKLKK